MKTKAPKTPADISTEELEKLSAALRLFEELGEEKSRYNSLLTEATAETDEFARSGDLLDSEKVSAIVVRQTQATLAERRVANLTERSSEAEIALDQQAEVVKRLIETALHQVKNGVAEKIAKALKEHYENFQDARHQALMSKQVKAVNDRIYSLNNFRNSVHGESVPIATEYLKLAPRVFAEVEEIKKQLGGAIPSESELVAL